ncbi:MAG: hypothetical protein WC140_01125 [Bacteroidales bacterium]
MKDSYDKNIKLHCIVCGGVDFQCNDDNSYIKCNRCGKEYMGGYEELVELNKENINQETEKTKEELFKDVEKDFTKKLKDVFKGDKNIKFEG